MNPLPKFFAGCVLISSSLMAQSFEGKVTMTIATSSDSGEPASIVYSVKDGFTRMDTTTGEHQASVIFDIKNRQMIILMPQRSMYMVQPMPAPGSTPGPGDQGGPEGGPPPSPATFEATGETDTILGYVCKKYLVTSADGTSQIWATDQLGTFGGFNLGGRPGGRSRIPQDWAAALQGKSFFPMRVIGNSKGRSFRLDVTAVDKESLPDSDFAPPDGWQKFDMGSFMQGMGAGGFHLPGN